MCSFGPQVILTSFGPCEVDSKRNFFVPFCFVRGGLGAKSSWTQGELYPFALCKGVLLCPSSKSVVQVFMYWVEGYLCSVSSSGRWGLWAAPTTSTTIYYLHLWWGKWIGIPWSQKYDPICWSTWICLDSCGNWAVCYEIPVKFLRSKTNLFHWSNN